MNIKSRLQKLEEQKQIDSTFCSCPNPYRKIQPPNDNGEPQGNGCFNCDKPLNVQPGAQIVVLAPTADGRGAREL